MRFLANGESQPVRHTAGVPDFIHLLGVFHTSMLVCVCVCGGVVSLIPFLWQMWTCLSVCFGRASVIVSRLLGAEWGPSIQRQTHTLRSSDWLRGSALAAWQPPKPVWHLKADTYMQEHKPPESSLIAMPWKTAWLFGFTLFPPAGNYIWWRLTASTCTSQTEIAQLCLGLFCFIYIVSTSALLWLLIIVASHFCWCFPGRGCRMSLSYDINSSPRGE